MRYRVTIEKVLEEFWGIDEFLAELGPASIEKQDSAIINELLYDDIQTMLDDASWTITREPEAGGEG